jgi:tetratricopeptide (TPR) repeat protein/photosystem II stability/assembly factor-like uncharacterized protein
MVRRLNPYFAGPPATQPDTFFGRQDVLRFVDETLASPMHNVIVFHGQRRIGKTSILHQIMHRSGQDYQAVFFDLQNSVASPAHDLFYDITREIAAPFQLPVPGRPDFQDDLDIFRTIFLPQIYERLGDRRLLLLLDEFDALSLQTTSTELDTLPFVKALNRVIQSGDKRVVFLFVIGRQLKDLTSQQLQIFRVARHWQITLLKQEDALQLITRPAQESLIYQDAAIERIWQLTNGHPYFIQLLCHEIFNQAQRQDTWTVAEAHVEAVIDDAISVGESALQWFWDAVSPVERFALYTIGQLEVEAGWATLDQLATQRSLQGVQVTDFELRALPDQLVSREVLKRDLAGRYRFAVELVRRWIVQSHSLEEVTTKLTRVAVDEEAKTFFKAGQQAYWAEETELAVKNFSRALSINANYVEARLWLARAYTKMGDLLAAINEFVNVDRFGGPTQREARFGLTDVRTRLGQQLEEEGKIEEAIQEYKRVLELDSEHPLANMRLGQIFRDRADERLAGEGLAAAQSLYEQALRHDPDLEQAIKERLDQYSQTQEAANKWEEAEWASRLAATLMSRTGDNQEALLRVQLNWARWLLNHHELDTASKIYHRLLLENSGDPLRQVIENDILRYSQQQEEQNDWSQAEAALRLLVELFPGDAESRNRLVDSLCRQGEFFLDQADMVAAKAAYQRALTIDPSNQSLINLIRTGLQSYHRVRSEDKTVHTQKLVEAAMLVQIEILGQNDLLAYQALAEARTNLGDAWQAEHKLVEAQAVYQLAVDDITHALQFAPELGQAYRQRAIIWLKLGQIDLDKARFDEAVERFQQALVDARSDQEMIIDQIKRMFNDYRRRQEETLRWNYAERAMEILERLFPEDEEVRFWLAEIRVAWAKWHFQRALPDLDEAQRLARRGLNLELPRAKLHLIIARIKDSFQAYCLQQEQTHPPNWVQAEQVMNSLVTLLPDDPAIHRRLAETRANQGDWYLAYESQAPFEAQRYLLKAAEVYERALNDAPNDENLVTRLKDSFRSYQRRQQQISPPAWSLVEQSLQILAELLPNDTEVQQWLAVESLAAQGTKFLNRKSADPAEARTYLAEAKKAYEKALQMGISDKKALITHFQTSFRAYCQEQKQATPPQWDLAEEALVVLATLLPEEAETWAQQAELHATQADWLLQQETVDLAKVETLYRQALAQLPGPKETLAAHLQQQFRLYRLKQQQSAPPNWLAAEQILALLATLLPDDVETYWQLTEMCTERGNWHLRCETAEPEQTEAALVEAERFYQQALNTLPGDKNTLLNQIKENFKIYCSNQIQEGPLHWVLAERALTILAELLPEDEEVYGWLAEACQSKGQEAEQEAELISGWWRELEQAQKLEEVVRTYEWAVVAAERRVQLAPMNPAAWQQLAMVQAGLGRSCQTFRDEEGALNAYDSSLMSWRKALELDTSTALVKEVATVHLARGDILLQRGDLAGAAQDYLAANQLSPDDQPWLTEVDRRLQAYQTRQKPQGIQRQVVAAGELRYWLQPDNPVVWRELANELVTYGGEYLEDDQFELARQRYEQVMSHRPQTSNLDEVEHQRLGRIIRQDVDKFIQRQVQAGNLPQAEEARLWLVAAGLLTEEAVAPPRPEGRIWPRRPVVATVMFLMLCFIAAVFVRWLFEDLPPPPMDMPATTEISTAVPSFTSIAAGFSPVPMSTSPSLPTTAQSNGTTPSPSPTAIPTATSTSTNTPTPVEKATTESPPPTNTPTPANTSPPTPLPAPSLLKPENGAVFLGTSSPPRLEWKPVDWLGPDEYYLVKLTRQEKDRSSSYLRRWFKEAFWEIPPEIFQWVSSSESGKQGIEWQVVVAQISDGSIDDPVVKESASTSEKRTFRWWQPKSLPAGEGLDVAINPNNPSSILAILRGDGIYKSDNDGIDWGRVSEVTTFETLHFASANAKVIYAGAFGQILKSEDEGKMWQPCPDPPKAQVYAIATAPDNADIVFVATDRGIVRSNDGCQTWSALDRAGADGKAVLNRPFYNIIATSQNNRIYIAGEGNQIYWRGTSDTDSPWQTRICTICTPPIFVLAVDPKDSSKLLAGSDQGTLVISSDAGDNWNPVMIPPPAISKLKFSVLEFDPVDPNIVYAGSGTNRHSTDGEGLYRSLDGGLNWHRFNDWTSGGGAGTYIQGIAIHPTNSQIIFVAGSEGVFKSTDGGSSWKKQ